MSDGAKDAIGWGVGSLLVVAALLIGLWGAGWVFHNIGQWWKDVTYISPETKANWKAEADAWSKDPLNPDNIKKKCLDDGGYPGSDGWGNIQCHSKVDAK